MVSALGNQGRIARRMREVFRDWAHRPIVPPPPPTLCHTHDAKSPDATQANQARLLHESLAQTGAYPCAASDRRTIKTM